MPTLEWNAQTRVFATVKVENARALRITKERHANGPCAPTIALDVEFACPRSRWQHCRARRTLLHGTPRRILDASAMMDTVVRTVLRRNVHLEWISLAEMELPRDVTALDVVFATLLPVFASVSRDTMETGASIKLSSAKVLTIEDLICNWCELRVSC